MSPIGMVSEIAASLARKPEEPLSTKPTLNFALHKAVNSGVQNFSITKMLNVFKHRL